jgi:penicillin amidase
VTRPILRRAGQVLGGIVILLCVAVIVVAAWLGIRLERSRPRLEGTIAAAGLSAPVTVTRDADGVPTVTGRTRADVAYATGYLHAQERFFQMDMLRRAAAGELGALFGTAALDIDRVTRPHRFRARAAHVLAAMSPAERRTLDAYVTGVNRGLGDLAAAPFEYGILRQTPRPWTAADSMLVVYSMYLDLQKPGPVLELDRARAQARLGRGMADVLYPVGSELDTALDGSRIAPPPLPASLSAAAGARSLLPADEPVVKGSNNWAVAARLTATGSAMLANDMHLSTRVPNIWYRARLVVRESAAAAPSLDVIGVTLPGLFATVVGSNRHVAWGFTNSYIDTHDAVIVDPVPGRRGWYRSPAGPRPIVIRRERLCAAGACEELAVRETIWGPIVDALPDGRAVVDRWIAHDADAIRLAPIMAVESARTLDAAIAAAHRAALPEQNMAIADSTGRVAWTIIGQVPRRFGFDGRDATSWADGTRGWRGRLSSAEIPVVADPSSGRIWTANARVVGGAALARLGDGGYDDGSRARQIGRRLFAQDRFAERDMLSIQLDTRATRMDFWRAVMLEALQRHRGDAELAAMIAPVRDWDGRAETGSVGYRLIRTFRAETIKTAYVAYLGVPMDGSASHAGSGAEQAMRQLLRARPPALVAPGYRTWDGVIDAGLAAVAGAVRADAGGRLTGFSWGGFLHADVRHPLARAIPLLGLLTDPKDGPAPGDAGVVRAQYVGAGASERMVVSPGHEESGLFHMPGGQSGAPFAPYYLAGHRAWAEGRARPLLPGPTRWTLTFAPEPR